MLIFFQHLRKSAHDRRLTSKRLFDLNRDRYGFIFSIFLVKEIVPIDQSHRFVTSLLDECSPVMRLILVRMIGEREMNDV